MNDKINLFKALLRKEFFDEYKHKLSASMFSDQLEELYDALIYAHLNTDNDIGAGDVWASYKILNPAVTASHKQAVYAIINSIKDAEELDEDIAKQVINRALIEDKATKIAQTALEIAHGRHQDWTKIESILNEDVTKEDIDYVTTDLSELSKDISSTYKWRFNLAELDQKVGPIGPEVFTVLAGNVNAGKSLAAISFVCAPNGFLEQGAKVLYIGNEESLKRTVMRGASSYTGLTKQEIAENLEVAQKAWDKVRNNFYPVDDVTMNFTKLNYLVSKLLPDIVVLDMLDNIKVSGDFQRGDEKLGRIYQSARELAKRFRCAVIGLSQTGAAATGKLHVGFDKLAGSKVDKAAAADLILILGSLSEESIGDGDNSNFRCINVAKSKLEGNGERIHCQIQPMISRLVA